MHGPTTRARARQLNLQVRSNLINCVLELTLGAMDVLMIRNLGEDQQRLGRGQHVKEEKLGRSQQEKAKSDSTTSPPRSPGPVWKAKEIRLGSTTQLRHHRQWHAVHWEKFLDFCEDHHIRVDWAAVAHPMTNGQVERANGMILQGLKSRIYNDLESRLEGV
jgi:hypothetical protein